MVEIVHDLNEAEAFLAEHILRRHPYLVEIERGLIRCPPAHFLVERGAGKAFGIGIDQKQRNAVQALAAGARTDDKMVGGHPAGDKGLGTIDHPVIAVFPRHGLHIGDIRSATRLGNAEAGAFFAEDDIFQNPVFDFL